ncbi:NuA4-domain-containing protein [Schizopora paradoxa]|uniref:Chromatin modification-related protein EAF6 n=1 Tax=Schizopora paradoxa TaxID=27342 RepID=A0A0H2RT67_9AGAM|nr:NuA4-domain-containing protein [Schizopora paradoxa]
MAAVAVNGEASTSAVPSQEDKVRYDTLKKELAEQLNKKRATERSLAQLEYQLYNFENSYLTETMAHSGGNVILGFESYHKTQSSGRRKHDIQPNDRMFSSSSLTFQKSLELIGEGEDGGAGFDGDGGYIPNSSGTASTNITLSLAPSGSIRGGSRGPTPGLTTVVLPPAQSASSRSEATPPLTAAQQKKARDKEYQRRKRASMRNAVSVTGDEDEGSITGSTSTARRGTKRPRPSDDD